MSEDARKEEPEQATTESAEGGPIRIYIGGPVKEKDLKILFGAYGSISGTSIFPEYAFVDMADKAEAERAIKDLNGSVIEGKKLKIDFAHGPNSKKRRKML